MDNKERISPEKWGKDHFSTLLYLETRVVDHGGVIRGEQMRGRDSGYPCKLRSGERLNHGDLDCIEDMREAGLVTGGGRNKPYKPFQLTESGWRLAHLLRRHRGEGKTKTLPSVETVLWAIGICLDKGEPEGHKNT